MTRIPACTLTALLFFTAAPSAAPQTPTDTAIVWRSYAEKLTVGSTVLVRTTSGDRITGVLMLVDENGVRVKPKTRIPEPSRRIGFAELDDLRVIPLRPVSATKAVIAGAAIGAGVFVSILLALAGG
jgi:hypothetical protein